MITLKAFNQPLFAPTTASLMGVFWFALGCGYNAALLSFLWICTLPLVAHAYFSRKKPLRRFAVCFLILLTVALISRAAQDEFEAFYNLAHKAPIALSGTITSTQPERSSKKITLSDIAMSTPQKKQLFSWFSHAYVFTKKEFESAPGSHIYLKISRIKKPPSDLVFFLLKDRSLGFFFAKKDSLSTSPTQQKRQGRVDQKRNSLQALVAKTFSPKTNEAIQSIFLGKTHLLKNSTRSLFEQWGISHYLARSGLHLVMLVVLLGFLLNTLALPVFMHKLIMLAAVFLYHLLTVPSISFLRALLMNLALGGAFFAGTAPNTFHIFLVVTLVTILNNPFVVFFADFQLSFGISGALIFVFNKIQKLST